MLSGQDGTLGAESDRRAFDGEIELKRALFPLLGIAYQAEPSAGTVGCKTAFIVGRLERFEAENLDESSGGFAHTNAGIDDAGIVADQERVGRQKVGDIAEYGVGLDTVGIGNEQLALVADRTGMLGDALIGQGIHEIRHRRGARIGGCDIWGRAVGLRHDVQCVVYEYKITPD